MTASATTERSVLVIDGDVISRHAIADYLRGCGYSVIEAAVMKEAMTALKEVSLSIDIILCDCGALTTRSVFSFVNWVRQNRPELEVRITGNLEKSVEAAGELCVGGPQEQPSAPAAVVAYIKGLRATRERSKGSAVPRS